MSGTSRAGSYRSLLASPGTLRIFAWSAAGRGGYAMLPLLFLFTVVQSTGSFPVAALAMSAYGLSSFAMPLKSRLIDRYSQRRLLPVLGALVAVVLVAAALAAARGTGSLGVWVILAALVGLVAPPLGPSMRTQWRLLAPDRLQLAFSLDTVTEEALWLIGPVLSGLVLAWGPAWHGLIAPATLITLSCYALARSPHAKRQQSHQGSTHSHAALRQRLLWDIVPMMTLFGLAGSLLVTGVAAVAKATHRPGYAGIAEAAIAVGAVLGGLGWGRLHPHAAWHRPAMLLLLGWCALGLVAAPLHPGAAQLTVLACLGAAGAPLWVLAYVAADDAVPADRRTEASTWILTATNLGTAAGSATAGALYTVSPRTPILVAAATAALDVLAVGRARSRRT
ncbi:MFS transporter [Flexivirga caeni]|uniref:MFS transporter n=1 Tax=Flexivirga caeni TaxID=2294115 RepID=A0A3M9LYN1_9MICO|nr:MFS transporter [Flexivirga caeni]RNI18404.1 MFS transporter [Flexivirga caeni]